MESQHVARASLAKLDFGSVLSPPDPEANRQCGGTGVLIKRPLNVQERAPQSFAFRQERALGRASLAMAAVCTRTPLIVASVYGWASSDKNDA
eukprot:4277275-Alexandrium_andersonii.AAC.1